MGTSFVILKKSNLARQTCSKPVTCWNGSHYFDSDCLVYHLIGGYIFLMYDAKKKSLSLLICLLIPHRHVVSEITVTAYMKSCALCNILLY